MEGRAIVRDIFNHAAASVDPYDAVKAFLEENRQRWSAGVYVIGFGKAVSPMARACEHVLGNLLSGGYLITKYGHSGEGTKKLKIHEAGHPVPDENSYDHTTKLIEFVGELPADKELICLISGGGSALLCKPYEGISLTEKRKTTDLLLKAGADIFELNAVRKHISDVKGGRLLEFFKGERLTSLILSDVIGNRLDVIASGPTTYDESTFGDALGVIQKYGLEVLIPERVIKLLRDGKNGLVPETLKKGSDISGRVKNVIIGSLDVAMDAAGKAARGAGLEVLTLAGYVTGEARGAGRMLGRKAKEMAREDRKPVCIITGGETTVTVKGKGKGGRNMELALSFALEIAGMEGMTMLSAGTDGTDGPTDAAGAIVDGETIGRAEKIGVDPEAYLDDNDTYSFFKKTGELFVTGPTGTNVMDMQIIIIP